MSPPDGCVASAHHRCLEPPCLADGPRHHEATIAPADDANTFAIHQPAFDIDESAITNTLTNAMLLRWPSESTGGLVLQQNTNLAGTNWSVVAQLPADDGTNKSVLSPAVLPVQVFRLKWP